MGSRLVLLACVFMVACGCHPGLPTAPPPMPSEECEATGKHLSDLGCGTTMRGVPFVVVCRDHAVAGLAYPHACIRASKTCKDAMPCR